MLVGFDIGYYANCLTGGDVLPECRIDAQYFGDMRRFPAELLKGIDAIVRLAAISNDPIGNKFEEVTLDINYRSSVNLATKARDAGVSSFVFASSCSMYGSADDGARTEDSQLNPLTAYAKSKVLTEQGLKPLASNRFNVTCLRFSTACGWSDRLRLDLVLNDFVAGAVASGRITILSDGTPWRPLINVRDMARAIDWAISRDMSVGGPFLAVNALLACSRPPRRCALHQRRRSGRRGPRSSVGFHRRGYHRQSGLNYTGLQRSLQDRRWHRT